ISARSATSNTALPSHLRGRDAFRRCCSFEAVVAVATLFIGLFLRVGWAFVGPMWVWLTLLIVGVYRANERNSGLGLALYARASLVHSLNIGVNNEKDEVRVAGRSAGPP